MSYTRYRAWNFGPAYAGSLANAGYALRGDTAWNAASEILLPNGQPSGAVEATVTHPDDYAGPLLWSPDATATPIRFALVEINPGGDERVDAKLSTLPASVWSHANRTITAFGFTVAATLVGGPVFRNQDGVTSPTYDDCLASAWAQFNAREVESDEDLTWVRYLPNGIDPMRSFVLTADANGNPIGRA